jgi:CHAT domain-containing protein
MVLCGVVLAGANAGLSGAGEDGILTAEEVSGLALDGVELVVLSACDTGRGEVRRGEGVLGLARGFSHAGAGTLVLSLWGVPDDATRELMDRFYGAVLAADPASRLRPLEALRRAQITLLTHTVEETVGGKRVEVRPFAAPWAWGAFVAVGAP